MYAVRSPALKGMRWEGMQVWAEPEDHGRLLDSGIRDFESVAEVVKAMERLG